MTTILHSITDHPDAAVAALMVVALLFPFLLLGWMRLRER